MPSRLSSPMLSLDINHIAKVDPRNVDNLFSMWTIFSKCAESLENGRRLENLSWRVWNRETFCCEEIAAAPAPTTTTTTAPTPVPAPAPAPATSVPRKPKRQDSDAYLDLPDLSTSVESATSDYELRSDAVNIKSLRSCLLRTDSGERYRGKEKHMTPVHLVKLMEDLDKSKSSADDWMSKRPLITPPEVPATIEPSMPEQSSCSPVPSALQTTPVGSATSCSTEVSAHSVVRGFTPGQNISTSVRSSACLSSEQAVPVEKSLLLRPKKPTKRSMFIIGSSNSSASDDESDSEVIFTARQPVRKSRISEGLRRSTEKRTSFRSEVITRTFRDDDIYTEDEEVISESAIEDEDSSDWESSTDDSAQSSYNQPTMFQRVESRPQLVSRRSLLSTMLHEPKRAALANAGSRSTPALRSRTTSPSGPSLAPSLQRESPLPPTSKPTAEITRSKPIIMTTSNMHPPAFSPRTTRRNMLATELTESLRRNLLWERQQKNTTAAAVLKRRHTAHDITKLNDFPQVNYSGKDNTSKNNSWNHCFDQGLEYHVAGW